MSEQRQESCPRCHSRTQAARIHVPVLCPDAWHGQFAPDAPLRALVERIVRRVAELPDRTSPDDWPEAMLVTGEELTDIVADELSAALSAAPAATELDALREELTTAREKRPFPYDLIHAPTPFDVSGGRFSSAQRMGWHLVNEKGFTVGVLCDRAFFDRMVTNHDALEIMARRVDRAQKARAAAPAAGWQDISTGFDYERLDPGIRTIVRTLRQHGFQTCDSGDGVSKLSNGYGPDDIIPVPHVFSTVDRERAFSEAERMQTLLGEAWDVEASLRPKDGTALIEAYLPAPPLAGPEPSKEKP